MVNTDVFGTVSNNRKTTRRIIFIHQSKTNLLSRKISALRQYRNTFVVQFRFSHTFQLDGLCVSLKYFNDTLLYFITDSIKAEFKSGECLKIVCEWLNRKQSSGSCSTLFCCSA
jgi:hypothetical protein